MQNVYVFYECFRLMISEIQICTVIVPERALDILYDSKFWGEFYETKLRVNFCLTWEDITLNFKNMGKSFD